MSQNYTFLVPNSDFKSLGHILAVANLYDKHDRSAPSDYHWKILKCRMVIFSNSSILACPDKNELSSIHFIFNKTGDDFDKLNSLFIQFSLLQQGEIRTPSADVYQMCFQYTMTARIAPSWNILGHNYLINNREFLSATTPQDGLRYSITCDDHAVTIAVKPMKINFIRSREEAMPEENVRVLPRRDDITCLDLKNGIKKILITSEPGYSIYLVLQSKICLNKAILEEVCETMPESTNFKSYKDLKRHWKNIHGYRLPEKEGSYYLVRFWRGEPLTYPKACVVKDFPIVTPRPAHEEVAILSRFLICLKSKMPHVLGKPLILNEKVISASTAIAEKYTDSQAVSLCTPTQPPQDFQFQ